MGAHARRRSQAVADRRPFPGPLRHHQAAGRGLSRPPGHPGGAGRPAGRFHPGFLTNALNPKAALFLSVLPQFVHGGGSTARQIFFLCILDVLIGLAYWFALAAVAARLRKLLALPKIRHRRELTTLGVAAAGRPHASPEVPRPVRAPTGSGSGVPRGHQSSWSGSDS
ncbi:LysE family transporter [Streptomyces sp. NPDC046915]|uniref:LysE family translocator n=1 Tax=Streptomyces sp. NPDC046915 TaxID=3155257 RepID=UPI0033DEAC52